MSEFRLRPITPDDRDELAELVCLSTNHWYQVNRGITIFPGGEEVTAVFPDVYQALDPGCGVAAEHARNGDDYIISLNVTQERGIAQWGKPLPQKGIRLRRVH